MSSPTQDDCSRVAVWARAEADRIWAEKPHSAFHEEADLWGALAAAAHACETLLVRRHLCFNRGAPPQIDFPDGYGDVQDKETEDE